MLGLRSILADVSTANWSTGTRLLVGSSGVTIAIGCVVLAVWLTRWHLAHRDNGQLSLLPLGLIALLCLLLAMTILVGTAATNTVSPGGAIISTP